MPRYNAITGSMAAAATARAATRAAKTKSGRSETPLSQAADRVPDSMFAVLEGHKDAGAIAKARFVDWCRDPSLRYGDWREAWKAFQAEKAKRKEAASAREARQVRQAGKAEPKIAERSAKPGPADPSPAQQPPFLRKPEHRQSAKVIPFKPAPAKPPTNSKAAAAAFIDAL